STPTRATRRPNTNRPLIGTARPRFIVGRTRTSPAWYPWMTMVREESARHECRRSREVRNRDGAVALSRVPRRRRALLVRRRDRAAFLPDQQRRLPGPR